MRRLVALLVALLVVAGGVALAPPTQPHAQTAPGVHYLETFDDDPAVPVPFYPPGWDVAVHSRDRETHRQLTETQAHHGPDCSPPMNTHPNTDYRGSVYLCRNHMMTSIHSGPGYAMIALTPDHMVDLSQGEAVIRWDVSTFNSGSLGRDFWDVWVTPFEENLQLPFHLGDVDLQGPPKNAVQIRLQDTNGRPGGIKPVVYRNHNETGDFQQWTSDYDSFLSYLDFLTPSASRRDTFELRLSRTHLSICMPDYGRCWADKSIQQLPFTRGVVTFGHHSYNPEKDCWEGGCASNTWHWDDISISPAVPFSMLKADKRLYEAGADLAVLTGPTPAGARLRFSGIGDGLQVSLNGGGWQAAGRQAEDPPADSAGHFANYWMPIPAGVTTVRFRGQPWYGGPWLVKDVAVWSEQAGTPPPPVTATPSPTPTSAPPTATATSPPAATATPVPPTATATPAGVVLTECILDITRRYSNGTTRTESTAMPLTWCRP